MLSKKMASIDKNICVACGACKKECPKNAITIKYGVYAKSAPELCIGCGKCEKVCPASCISIILREER